jgi:putative membrane protein (TIGR04086 family)
VVARGAASALVLGAPVAVIYSLLSENEQSHRGLLSLLSLLLLFSFALGGYAAGREAKDLPAKHAAAAGAAAFVVIQLLGSLARLSRGDSVSVPRIVLTALLAMCVAVLGGLLAGRTRRMVR